ncbi:MAG: hypothetical protein M3R06_04135 [Chloroflexota bacterium]|nr:hypothetical protein [Chloroflexota bacterium]
MATPNTLAAATQIQPLRQGDHDNLCCLYAAINALRLVLHPVHKLGSRQTKKLFVHGARLIDARGSLLSVLEEGMEEPLWIDLCASLASEAGRLTGIAIKLTFLLDSWPKPSSRVALDRIKHALRSGSPVLILLHGAYDHCSVAAAVTQQRLVLFDSHGFKWVSLKNVGISHPRSNRLHQIPTTSAVALSLGAKR